MDYALIFTVFALVIALVVLRFTAIVNQTTTRMSLDHQRAMQEVENSHTTAFTNAMIALEQVQQRIVDSQMKMFERTTDMVHGPMPGPPDGQLPVDLPNMDLRPPWAPTDDEDNDKLLFADPTDDLMPDPPIEPQDNGHRAVSIRPGEGLIPNG